MARRQYRVIGHCALFTADTAQGPMRVMVYRGKPVPDGATDEEIRHNLSVGLIAPLGEAEPLPELPSPAADATSPTDGSGGDSVPADDPERVKAREKLPEDGSAPHVNAGEAVWVEYAVTRGYDYEAAKAAGKAELVKLLKG